MKGEVTIRIVKIFIPITILEVIAALLMFLDSEGESEGERERETIDIWLTTADQQHLLTKQGSVVFEDNNGSNLPIIQVDPTVHFQTMEGFGAAITGSSAYLINHKMDNDQRDTLMKNLFTDEGINMSFIRHTIGASDFSVDESGNPESYTYNDINTDTDYELNQFTVEKEH
ncbi:hypothetical protein FS935_21430 [Metabacillus litoralis]|uniref:Glycosyl hydrolase family 30 TIM-barrel domain-containing protein n=1 Tax=Metabacillus litoralis TaxID=152268 RepID=A0A5C6VF79_9BACI|nr:hypothetical protein [Metabacillus litoralis]TXC81908.1 hypothetical protein FS935_21430 [Metabacillus litoralis]